MGDNDRERRDRPNPVAQHVLLCVRVAKKAFELNATEYDFECVQTNLRIVFITIRINTAATAACAYIRL